MAQRRLLPEPEPSALLAFQNAVRAKTHWYAKLLDAEKTLGRKWAVEAGLLALEDLEGRKFLKIRDIFQTKLGTHWVKNVGLTDGTSAKGRELVYLCLSDLKSEAHRIVYEDHAIHTTSRHLPSRPDVDFRTIDVSVRMRLNFITNAQHAIRATPTREDVGVFESQGLVPVPLHRELVKELDALTSLHPRDYHPGTFGKVQDLIHPSLYPFFAGHTPTSENSLYPKLQDGMFKTTMSPNITFASPYAWIPTIFNVANDGRSAHIQSHINGLGPRESYPMLYSLLEKVFLFVLPHFQRTLDTRFASQNSPSVWRWFERLETRQSPVTLREWNRLLRLQQAEKKEQATKDQAAQDQIEEEARLERQDRSLFKSTSKRGPFHGESLKVIVKAANYILRPGEKYEGTWHIEGMPHERIVASAIYYYDADPEIVDQGLALRRLRQYEEFPVPHLLHHEQFRVRIVPEQVGSKRTQREWSKTQAGLGEVDPGPDEDVDKPRWLHDYPSDWEEVNDPEDSSTSSLGVHINVGIVNTATNHGPHERNLTGEARTNQERAAQTGKIISFPNWLQHRVVGVSNPSPAPESGKRPQPALRKILCFFLVDDNDLSKDEAHYPGFSYSQLGDLPVLTSSDIPSEMRACNFPTLRWILPLICLRITGKPFPPMLTERVLHSAHFGISREMAEQRRRAFMEERQANRQNADDGRVPYSLCEH